ncbi:MAG: NAD(P)H-dependent oxidoreductase [Pseudomonadota bacterium]
MKILAFAASSSSQSINQQLARYTASQFQEAKVELLDISDYEIPLFSEDREKELGQPELARRFYEKITWADALIISFAEHNGSYTAAYKNLFDWTSRIDRKVFQSKPAIYLSTSPGAGGAANVLSAAVASAPHFGADVIASVSVPRFYERFDAASGQVTDSGTQEELNHAVQALRRELKGKVAVASPLSDVA